MKRFIGLREDHLGRRLDVVNDGDGFLNQVSRQRERRDRAPSVEASALASVSQKLVVDVTAEETCDGHERQRGR
ncbi:MAG: hypothetical protein EPO35_12585 [Acidobacteria bacterium]|nr:MAG: hypothetical protein EPO35_12585 [Acidobacteriota bacterium]